MPMTNPVVSAAGSSVSGSMPTAISACVESPGRAASELVSKPVPAPRAPHTDGVLTSSPSSSFVQGLFDGLLERRGLSLGPTLVELRVFEAIAEGCQDM